MYKRVTLILFLFLATTGAIAQEICDNGIDDDGDGLVDLNDMDCNCDNLIDLSLIPNPSFELTDCCPDSEEDMDCATFWNQASDATVDYLNTCDFSEIPFVGAVPPVMPLPGGGDGFIGLYNFLTGYREYVGSCLPLPLLAGVTYTLNFHTSYAYGTVEEIDLSFYGSPNCGDLPWVGTSCPEGLGAWEELVTTSITYTMDGFWQSVAVEFTPTVDLFAISFGANCGEIIGGADSYFYFDEIVLMDTETYGYIEEVGGWCSDDLVLNAIMMDEGGTWQWYKDGVALIGETSSSLSPIPYGEGKFTVRYNYAAGCKTVDYQSPSVVVSGFDTENVCFGTSVLFTNTSEVVMGDFIERLWVFGDGDFSTDENPVHSYGAPGLYEVELINYSEDPSCNDTARVEVTVSAQPEPDFSILGLGVSGGGSSWQACSNVVLSFMDETTIDGAVSIASWMWYFGDGGTSSEQNPFYNFSEGDDYNVKLIVTAENGCVDSIDVDLKTMVLKASFLEDSACLRKEVVLDNLSEIDPLLSVDLSVWSYGDGSPLDTVMNTTHVYNEIGSYDVSLLVTTDLGCIDSVTKSVVVNPSPNPYIYYNPNPADYFNTEIELSNNIPDDESGYVWLMPEAVPDYSVNSSTVHVVYPVFEEAFYPVTLIETNKYGCIDSAVINVHIEADQLIYAPNAFTPNTDFINSTWGVFVEGFDLSSFTLSVFNRWGEELWRTNDPTATWDGVYFGKTVQAGTYVWVVKARDAVTDEIYQYRGFVSVVR